MNSLEVLLNAEASLMNPDEPYKFADWPTCTCGHIYHGATGHYSEYNGPVVWLEVGETSDVYIKVMREVAVALGLRGDRWEPMSDADLISDYTKKVSGLGKDEHGNFPFHKVTREDSLKVIREAIEKIRAMDMQVIKSLDAHNHEVV